MRRWPMRPREPCAGAGVRNVGRPDGPGAALGAAGARQRDGPGVLAVLRRRPEDPAVRWGRGFDRGPRCARRTRVFYRVITIGAVCFGLVAGYLTYRTLVRTTKDSKISDLSAVLSSVGGGAATALVCKGSDAFGWYAIGLAALDRAASPAHPARYRSADRRQPRPRNSCRPRRRRHQPRPRQHPARRQCH